MQHLFDLRLPIPSLSTTSSPHLTRFFGRRRNVTCGAGPSRVRFTCAQPTHAPAPVSTHQSSSRRTPHARRAARARSYADLAGCATVLHAAPRPRTPRHKGGRGAAAARTPARGGGRRGLGSRPRRARAHGHGAQAASCAGTPAPPSLTPRPPRHPLVAAASALLPLPVRSSLTQMAPRTTPVFVAISQPVQSPHQLYTEALGAGQGR